MNNNMKILFAVLGFFGGTAVQATSQWNTQDYDLYPGDFNGDRRTDMLYVAKSPDKGSGIALSDGAQLIAGHQVWNANGFGIPWHSNVYRPVIGDFNWDGRSDIFMHRQTPGDHYVLFSNADGTFAGISQAIGNNTGGLVWSGDQHRVMSIRAYNSAYGSQSRGHRLFLQSAIKGGLNALIATAPTQGITGAIIQSWSDGFLGFQWNLRQAVVYSGDFNNDGAGDLLVQAKPDVILIDYEIPIPVPHYRPHSFGIVYSSFGSGGYTMWDRMRAGVDWSANSSNLVIADYDGDGRDDVIIQSRRSGGPVHLIRANPTTSQLYLDAPATLTFANAGSVDGDRYRVLAANVNGTGFDGAAGVYLQATSLGGTDFIAHAIPSAGGSVATTVQSEQYQSSPVPGTAAGSIAGEFSVDPSGAAAYRIPIETPPGIAGLKPDLALSYSSRGGNGLSGVGWTVTGLSAITRCAMTYEQDGRTDGVDLDADDAYCLDGARLKAIAGGNGQVGAEYRTEIESFQKITSVGGVAHDPGYWVIRDKSGLIRYYGASADSRIELQGKTHAHVWAVNRIEDRYGNFIEHSYTEINALSNFQPTDVRWGRTGAVVGRVHFEYWATRPDPSSGYLAGSIIGNSKLLKQIEVFSRPSALMAASEATRRVRSYFLNYEQSPNTGLMHLKELVLCDGADGSARRCLASTKFRWQHSAPGFGAEVDTNVDATARPYLRPSDFNGDGRTDYFWTYTYGSNSPGEKWGHTPGQFRTPVVKTEWPTNDVAHRALTIDYDSNGTQDLLQPSGGESGGGSYQWMTTVSGTAFPTLVTTNIPSYAFYNIRPNLVGDFDGDGTQDLAYASRALPSSVLRLHFNRPGGFAPEGVLLPDGRASIAQVSLNGVPLVDEGLGPWPLKSDGEISPTHGSNPALYVVDFDRDGRDEILARIGTDCAAVYRPKQDPIEYRCAGQRYSIYAYEPIAQTLNMIWSQTVDASNPEWKQVKVFDANGDGLSDVVYATPSGWALRVGTGAPVQGLLEVWSAGSFTGSFRVLDPETRRYYTETRTVTLDLDRMKKTKIVDYDRDGRFDLMFPESTSNTWFVLRSTPAAGSAFSAQGIDTRMPVTDPNQTVLVDDRGDGLPDVLYPSGSTYKMRYGRGMAGGVIDQITNGLGAVTQIQYVSIAEQANPETNKFYTGHTPIYEADGSSSNVAFPYQNALLPLVVVAQIAQDNGLGAAGGSSVHTAYKYAGLKAHRRGRGLLGFASITVQNVNTHIVTENRAAQRFPYTGMVVLSEQRYPSVTTLQNSTADLTLSYDIACDSDPGCKPAHPSPPVPVTVDGPTIASTRSTYSTLTWSSTGRWFPYSLTSVETVYPLQSGGVGGAALKRTTTQYLDAAGGTAGNRYDDYGNPYYIKVTVDDGEGGDPHVVSTANTYTNDPDSDWCLGRLTQTIVTHSKSAGLSGNPGSQSITRRSTFTYRPAPYCDLDVETIEPGTSDEQWTDHDYDAYGNKTSSRVGGAGVPIAEERTTTADYTQTQGQFAAVVTNALGQQEHATWDSRFGVKVDVTGPNGLTSTAVTDSFGRVTSETPIQGLGVYTNTQFYWCAYLGCYDSRSVMVVTGAGSDGSQVRTEFDRLNRETRTGKRTFDGRWLWTEKHYDPLGREYLVSQPYYDSDRKCWTFRRFDLLGRITHKRDPYKTGDNSDGECGGSPPAYNAADSDLPGGVGGGRITEMQYDLTDGALIGVRTTEHGNDPTAKRVGLKWVNVFGRTRAVQDEMSTEACSSRSSTSSAACLATFYDHDAQGNLSLVRQSGQISAGANLAAVTINTTATFNRRGFKTGMVDPDLGSWTYNYNAFGEVTGQTDANGQRTEFHYDKLGRMDWRTEQGDGTAHWYYDETTIGGLKAVGKLTRVVGPGGDYEERYVYDEQGRLISTKRKMDGLWHRIDQTYDAQSRIDLLKYPSWSSSTNPESTPADADRIVVRHNYNAYGFLTSTQNASSGTTYWQVNSIDQYGVTQETFGNGVVTRRVFEATTGYVRSITSGMGSTTAVQSMAYELDRNGNLLKRADLNAGRSEDFAYDAVDRLTSARLFANASWSGTPANAEGMTYDVFGNIRSKGAGYAAYNYLADTSGASLCSAPANPTVQPHAVRQLVAAGATRTLCYDRNGNITRQLNGQYDAVTWWVSNLARRISKGGDYSEFTYAPDRSRYKQTAVKASVVETTLYVSGLYERITKSGVTEHTYYIKGGSGAVAISKCLGACSTTTSTIKYLHRDHLGSVVALSDGAGLVAAADRMSFDAWGKRRANTWTATPPGTQISSTSYTSFTRRGYTGHEHLDFLGVVHMNGRVYDSEIGRFLTADPFVQFPESTQGLNRYAYVGNNPLTYTDPSGFFSFKKELGFLFQVVATAIYPPGAPLWAAINGAIQGGSEGAAIGFVSSGFGAIGGGNAFIRALAQGAVGGALSIAMGGRFSDGLVSAFVSSLAGSAMQASGLSALKSTPAYVARIIIRAVVGGTVSDLSGGSFANGALAAAFAAAVEEGARMAEVMDSNAITEDKPDAPLARLEGHVRVSAVPNHGILITITGRLTFDHTVSPDQARAYLNAIHAAWNTRAKYLGVRYAVNTSLELGGRIEAFNPPGKFHLTDCGSLCGPREAFGRSIPLRGLLMRSGIELPGTESHEFGHVLGLGHRTKANLSIMNSYWDVSGRRVTGYDLYRLEQLYGR